MQRARCSATRQRLPRRRPARLALTCACAALIASLAMACVGGPAAATAHSRAGVAAAGKLTKAQRKQIIALIKQFAGATGPAGGALAGSYPNPTFAVAGGPCANGQALTNISSLAKLTCSPGVYTDANENVAAGPSTLAQLGAGVANSAFGFQALKQDSSGIANSALGANAMEQELSGSENTGIGQFALSQYTSGSGNTAVGREAMIGSTGTGTGSDNTAVGTLALTDNSTGGSNTALGASAGRNLTTGSNNIDINNNGSAGDANKIKIGVEGTQTSTSIAGIDGETSTSGVAVLVNSNGTLGTTTSSRRYKRDIHPLGGLTSRLMSLRPVSFHYRNRYADGGPNPLQFGLVAEQVAKVLPNLVADDRNGHPYEVRYQELPALLLAQVQRQQAQIDHQRAQIRWLLRRVRGG